MSRKTQRMAGSFDCPPSFPPQRESRAALVTFPRHSPRTGNPEPSWLPSPATLPVAGIQSHFGYLLPSLSPHRESRATLITFSRHSPRTGNPEPLWLPSPVTLPAARIQSHFGYLLPSFSPQRESRALVMRRDVYANQDRAGWTGRRPTWTVPADPHQLERRNVFGFPLGQEIEIGL